MIAMLFAAAVACGVDVEVRFVEGAPVDRLVIDNRSATRSVERVAFDLRGSAGGLIFDIAEGGTGAGVVAPLLEVEAREAERARVTKLVDGGRDMVLDFVRFAPGGRYAVSLDLDDTLSRETIVEGAEIEGARVRVILQGESEQEVRFDADAKAVLTGPACK